MEVEALRGLIRSIPDHPQAGVTFRDLTPLLASAPAFASLVDRLAEPWMGRGIVAVVGVEARGFIVAGPVAERLAAGFVPVRKPGKLPWQVESVTYDLEYGTDTLEIHRDALTPGDRVLVIDDVLATGGTAAATVALLEGLGAEVVGLGFAVELEFLAGRDRLAGRDIHSLITY